MVAKRFNKDIMFKLFAIMCFLVNGEVQCVECNDAIGNTFDDRKSCDKVAEVRFYDLVSSMEQSKMPYKRVVVGCEGPDES